VATDRRLGTEGAENRAALLDAAERIMREEGYAAVTSRHLAETAKLKPQLVHYYFRKMDDIFIALFRRFSDRYLENQLDILLSDTPLTDLWDNTSDTENATLMFEFMALSNHRKNMRSEIARFGKQFRTTQIKIIEKFFKDRDISGKDWPSIASLSFMMEALSRTMAFDKALGVTQGDADTREFVKRLINDLEILPSAKGADATASRRNRAS